MADAAPLIRDRLKAEVSELKEVKGALDFGAIKKNAIIFPAAFVFLAGDSGKDNNLAVGAFRQEITSDLSVVLAVRAANDRTGEKTSDELEELRSLVRAALVGWEPGSGFDPVALKRGRLLGFSNSVAFWEDTYRTRDEIRA